MKSVVLALKNGMTMTRFVPLVEELQREGIAVLAYLAEEPLPNREAALYITDSGEVVEKLKTHSLPVLGFSHKEGDLLSNVAYVMEEPEEVDSEYLERIYRRYRDVPWEILETERCIIRESTIEDVDAFFEIYQDEAIVKYTDSLCTEPGLEKVYMREYIDKIYRYFEFGIWTVLWKETGEIIGRAGFAVRDGYELPDLGFLIAKPWRRKGITYEVCSALLEYGKAAYEFEQVQALVMPENTPSRSLCRKLGFVEEKRVMEKGKEYLFLIK